MSMRFQFIKLTLSIPFIRKCSTFKFGELAVMTVAVELLGASKVIVYIVRDCTLLLQIL